jgi:hypothetical protein
MCGRSVEKGTELYQDRRKMPKYEGRVYFKDADFWCYQCMTLDDLAEKIAHEQGWDDALTMQMFVLTLEKLPDTTPWKKSMKEWWQSGSYMDGADDGDLIIEAIFDEDDNLIASRTLKGEERARFEREFQ